MAGNKTKDTGVMQGVKFMPQVRITVQCIWEKKPSWTQTIDPSFVLKMSKFFNNLFICNFGIWIWSHMKFCNPSFDSYPLITVKVQSNIISYLQKNGKGPTSNSKVMLK